MLLIQKEYHQNLKAFPAVVCQCIIGQEKKMKKYEYIKDENENTEFPLSFMQEYMIKQSEMGFEKTGKREGYTNAGNAVRISMKLDLGRFERSLARCINESELLRSIAVKKGDKYTQKIIAKYDYKLNMVLAEGNTEEERYNSAVKIAAKAVQVPFDYFNDISINPLLIKIDDDDYIFVVIADHWISDGASLPVLLSDIFRYYFNPEAEKSNAGSYLDYIREEREFQMSEKGIKQSRYWDNELSGYEIVDISKAAEGKRSDGVDHFYSFDISKLSEISARFKVTNFYVMLMAFHIALSIYFEKNDIVVAATSANRTKKYMQTFGLFAHSVANRMIVNEEDKLVDLLKSGMKKHSENMMNLQTCYKFDILQFCISYQNFIPVNKKNALPVEMAEIKLPVKRKFDRFYLGAYEGEKEMILIMLGDGEMYSEDFMDSIERIIECVIDTLRKNENAVVKDIRELYDNKIN